MAVLNRSEHQLMQNDSQMLPRPNLAAFSIKDDFLGLPPDMETCTPYLESPQGRSKECSALFTDDEFDIRGCCKAQIIVLYGFKSRIQRSWKVPVEFSASHVSNC